MRTPWLRRAIAGVAATSVLLLGPLAQPASAHETSRYRYVDRRSFICHFHHYSVFGRYDLGSRCAYHVGECHELYV